MNISVAFDAIAGDMSGTMMQVATDFTMQSTISLFLSDQCCFYKSLIQLLPEGSTTVCYGGLSGGKVCFYIVFLFYFFCICSVLQLFFCRSSLYFQMSYIRNYNVVVFSDRQITKIIIATMPLNNKGERPSGGGDDLWAEEV